MSPCFDDRGNVIGKKDGVFTPALPETHKDPAVIVAEGYYRLKAENETQRDRLADEIHERSRLYSALATLRNNHRRHNTASIEAFVDRILANTKMTDADGQP